MQTTDQGASQPPECREPIPYHKSRELRLIQLPSLAYYSNFLYKLALLNRVGKK